MNQATSFIFFVILAVVEYVILLINSWINGIDIKIKLPNWVDTVQCTLVNTAFYLRYWVRALKWFCFVLAVYRELSILKVLPYDFFFM